MPFKQNVRHIYGTYLLHISPCRSPSRVHCRQNHIIERKSRNVCGFYYKSKNFPTNRNPLLEKQQGSGRARGGNQHDDGQRETCFRDFRGSGRVRAGAYPRAHHGRSCRGARTRPQGWSEVCPHQSSGPLGPGCNGEEGECASKFLFTINVPNTTRRNSTTTFYQTSNERTIMPSEFLNMSNLVMLAGFN
jgi:hypothetical protein